MIVAGACGLMALVLTAKHFQSADSSSAAAPKTLEALTSTPGAQHSGWLASEDEGPAGAGGGAATGSQRLADKVRAAAGGLSAERGSSPDWASRDAGAGMVAGQESSGYGSGASAGYSESNPIHAGANASPAEAGGVAGAGQSLSNAQGQTGSSGAGTEEVAKKSDNPADAASGGDPNAPVLSLPLDKSTEPDKGDQPIINENVNCGGSTDGCAFNTDSRFAIPDAANLSGEAGTISFCLQPQWAGDAPINASLVNLETPNIWENHLKIFKNGQFLRFSIWPNTGIESGAAAVINNWQPGQWHPVTVTYGPDPDTGVNMASIYVDGALAGQQPYDGQLEVPQQPLYIGSDMPNGEPAAGGSLMNFQAYNRVVTPDEAANFAGGCPQ
jgi:hypothetical protein